MDSWLVYAIIVAVLVTALVALRFGAPVATAVGAGLALLLAYLAGRSGGKKAEETDQLRERVENDAKREENTRRAEDAADRVRVDNARGGLRNDDGFRRD